MALIQTLVDDFSGSRDPTKWGDYGNGTVGESAGLLLITTQTSATYAGYYGVQTYSGAESYSFVQIRDIGNQDIDSYTAVPVDWNQVSNGDRMFWEVNIGEIRACKIISGVKTVLADDTYNAEDHRYLRLRSSAGTSYWDISSDGITWNNFHNVADPIDVTQIFPSISAGNNSAESTVTTLAISGFNIEPDDPTMGNLASESTRSIASSLQVSWKKDFDSSITIFTIGVSDIGGGDIIGGNVPSISAWNKYNFFDESEYLTSLEWEQRLNMPIGGASIGLAAATLDNTSGRFLPDYMGGNSELFTAILPRRPFIINAGFFNQGVALTESQFIGEFSKNPEVSRTNKTVQVQGEDFITFLKNKQVDNSTMFTGYSDSQIVESVLRDHMGLSTAQYEIEDGTNTIPFSLLESPTSFYDYIQEIAQASMAQFFQDESGILRYWNRQHWNTDPYDIPILNLFTADVIDVYSPDYDQIINVVEVKGTPRIKQTTTIYTLESPVELQPGANEVWITLDNPVLQANAPSITATVNEDGTGGSVSVTLNSTTKFTTAIKYEITNNTSNVGYITTMTVTGRWAIEDNPLYLRNQDDSSVTAYDERLLTIENNYIQSSSWANSFSNLVLSQFAEPESLQTIVIRAKPQLHVGQIITWQSQDWIVYGIKNSLNPSAGYIQELQLVKRVAQDYFTIGVSVIAGSDQIAP